jgi:hypothetical protein
MSATIIEQDEHQEPADELDTGNSVDQVEEKSTNEEDALPDKYKGKSLADIVRMHQEAEKLVGKQGQELGELRKVTDEYIKRTLSGTNPQPNTPAKEESEVDFFADPAKAVERIIERDPRIKNAAEAAEMVRRETAQRKLLAKFPDALEVAQNTDFQEWVSKSKVRTELFARADQNYDFEAAEELISTFKEVKAAKAPVATGAPKSDPNSGKMMPRAANTGNSEAPSSKKIYRRADIIKLQQVDPQRYMDMQPEIMEAYREGRVR